jgi:uncharacterized protein
MNWVHAINPLYILSGFCVGALVGMTGVGGGSLMTPILILLFGIHPTSAVGTDLLYAAATKAGGSLVHGFIGTIDWRVVGLLAFGSLPMAVLTVLILSLFDVHGGAVERVITFMLGLALLATAVALVFRARLIAYAGIHLDRSTGRRTASLTVLTGAALGVLVSLTSVGAGALGVTALIMLYPSLPMAHRRLRHRACGATHLGWRHRPLACRFDECGDSGLPPDRFAARHFSWQLCRLPRSGQGGAVDPCRGARHRRRQARVLTRRRWRLGESTAGGVLRVLRRACRSVAIWLGFARRMDAGEGLA